MSLPLVYPHKVRKGLCVAEGEVPNRLYGSGSATLHIPPHVQHYSVVVLVAQGRNGPFLVQERAKNVIYGGRLGLLGGRREGGESPEASALRELEEESGLDLAPGELHLFARLLAYDEKGNLSFGHIYRADPLNDYRVDLALSHKCPEGRVVLLERSDIGRNWDRLTSITSYALGAYFDLELAGAVQEQRLRVVSSITARLGLRRRMRRLR